MSGVRMPIRSLPAVGELGLALRRDQAGRCAGRRASRCRCSRRSTTAGRCRRPAGRRRPAPPVAVTSMPGSTARRGVEDRSSRSRLAVAGKPGEADDLAFMGDELGAVAAGEPAGREPAALSPFVPAMRLRRDAVCGAAATVAHGVDQPVAVECAGRVAQRPPCRRASPRCGRQFSRPRRADARSGCSSCRRRRSGARRPAAGRRVCASSEEVGSSRMTSRSGIVGDGEGARDLDHLAPADRQVADDVRRRRCRGPGKISSSLVADQLAGALAPAEAAAASGG